MTKVNAVKKLMDLAQRLQTANSICPYYFEREIENFEKEIIEIEDYLGKIIDDMQAKRFENYNCKKSRTQHDQSRISGQLLGMGNRRHYENKEETTI